MMTSSSELPATRHLLSRDRAYCRPAGEKAGFPVPATTNLEDVKWKSAT